MFRISGKWIYLNYSAIPDGCKLVKIDYAWIRSYIFLKISNFLSKIKRQRQKYLRVKSRQAIKKKSDQSSAPHFYSLIKSKNWLLLQDNLFEFFFYHPLAKVISFYLRQNASELPQW